MVNRKKLEELKNVLIDLLEDNDYDNVHYSWEIIKKRALNLINKMVEAAEEEDEDEPDKGYIVASGDVIDIDGTIYLVFLDFDDTKNKYEHRIVELGGDGTELEKSAPSTKSETFKQFLEGDFKFKFNIKELEDRLT